MSLESNQPAAGNETQQPKAPAVNTWSFHDRGFFQDAIPRGTGSEYYNALKKEITELYKSANQQIEVTVIEMSRATDPALDFSCILVGVRMVDNPKLGVAVHTLLITETGEEILPYMQPIDGRQVQVYRVPSDAFNEILIEKIKKTVSLRYNLGTNGRIFVVDGTVVTQRVRPENKTQVQKLALNAAMAGVTELESRRPEFLDLNLNNLVKTGNNQVEINFQHQELEDAAGNIYRSDIMTVLSDRKVGENQHDRKMNSGDKQAKFSEISSFVDTIWYPVAEQGGFANAFAPQQLAMTQKYVARQVITSIENNFATTPAAVLLALSTSLAIREPKHWIQAFRPLANTRSGVDIKDVGHLNIEGNIPVPQGPGILAPDPSGFGLPIDTKADDFKAEQLGMYITALFQKDLIIALDVPEYGPQMHYLGVFAAAARNFPGAYQLIVNAANQLTNGSFGATFPRAAQIFAAPPERVHAGYWTDVSGQARDIRDFDHVAVANLVGKRHPQMLREWSDTFLRTDIHELVRMDARRKMIMQLSGDTAKFTGFHQRLTFSAEFLRALDVSIQANGLRTTIRTPMSGTDFYNQRGVASFAPGAMLGYQGGFMSNGGYGQGQAAPASYYHQYRY